MPPGDRFDPDPPPCPADRMAHRQVEDVEPAATIGHQDQPLRLAGGHLRRPAEPEPERRRQPLRDIHPIIIAPTQPGRQHLGVGSGQSLASGHPAGQVDFEAEGPEGAEDQGLPEFVPAGAVDGQEAVGQAGGFGVEGQGPVPGQGLGLGGFERGGVGVLFGGLGDGGVGRGPGRGREREAVDPRLAGLGVADRRGRAGPE